MNYFSDSVCKFFFTIRQLKTNQEKYNFLYNYLLSPWHEEQFAQLDSFFRPIREEIEPIIKKYFNSINQICDTQLDFVINKQIKLWIQNALDNNMSRKSIIEKWKQDFSFLPEDQYNIDDLLFETMKKPSTLITIKEIFGIESDLIPKKGNSLFEFRLMEQIKIEDHQRSLKLWRA